MEEEMIYCKWVDASVTIKQIPNSCKEFIKDGRCNTCTTSDQIALGMNPADLLRNIKD